MPQTGPKPRFTKDMRRQLEEMRERGLSQHEIARSFGVSQQTISRELAKAERVHNEPNSADASDQVAFANGFEKGLPCLIALYRHYQEIVGKMSDDEALEWRDMALAAYRVRFKKNI